LSHQHSTRENELNRHGFSDQAIGTERGISREVLSGFAQNPNGVRIPLFPGGEHVQGQGCNLLLSCAPGPIHQSFGLVELQGPENSMA
jgi:hypothetical protein